MPADTSPTRASARGRRRIGLRIARIGGIPIVLSVSWLLSVLIIAVLATPVVEQAVPGLTRTPSVLVAIGLGVLLGVSVLAHELGHCLAANAFGVPVLQVRLYLLGGVSELGRLPDTPREEAAIAAAGPGVSALLAGIFGLLVGSTTPHTVGWLLLIELALANLVVAIFNFLPALPLDGGRVLRAGVWRATGRRRYGTLAAVIGGYVIALALLIWGTLEIIGSTRAALLQGAVAVVMAVFVGAGAAAEQNSDRGVRWPSDVAIGALASPLVQLPDHVTVALALQVAAGRAVLLTGADGVAVGLLDERDAIRLAARQPQAPATQAATPIDPALVVFPHDDPAEVAQRANIAGERFLLVDDSGRATGVVLAADVARILTGRRSSS